MPASAVLSEQPIFNTETTIQLSNKILKTSCKVWIYTKNFFDKKIAKWILNLIDERVRNDITIDDTFNYQNAKCQKSYLDWLWFIRNTVPVLSD